MEFYQTLGKSLKVEERKTIKENISMKKFLRELKFDSLENIKGLKEFVWGGNN